MDEKIINALTENRLFDGNYKAVKINNERRFFNEYHVNKGRRNYFPSNIARNKDGFLILDNESFIVSDRQPNGHNHAFWILLSNGSRILLKDVNYEEISAELLFKYYAMELNVPCAHYDVVSLRGKTYLASASFLSPEEHLFDYYNNNINKIKKDVDVPNLLKKASEISQETFVKKTLILDILVNNIDRFPNNFKVVSKSNKYRICPLFDNGTWEEEKKAIITYPTVDGSQDKDDLAQYLISDVNIRNWCLQRIIRKSTPNLKDKINNEKHIYVDDHTLDLFNENCHNGKIILMDAIKSS